MKKLAPSALLIALLLATFDSIAQSNPYSRPAPCKPDSYKKWDAGAPVNSGISVEERKQAYCDYAVKQIQYCMQSYQQLQSDRIDEQAKIEKMVNCATVRDEKRIASIKAKYCLKTSSIK
ncbi:hypothetical protein [Hymenobacter mucosus]|uniref:hypothetical protein n=1 Tax=Hymenobacter mucosus TaxID=1411120 RepID=UPI00117A1321|nr:hypothetical protein [Hymenobacter mucosus]